MIKIIKTTSAEWTTSCLHCRCEFVYEYSDLVRMREYDERPAWIACPSCGQLCTHVLARPVVDEVASGKALN